MKILWMLAPLYFANSVSANTLPALWQDISARNTRVTATSAHLQDYRLLHLDEAQWLAQADTLLTPNTLEKARTNLPRLDLPLPDGGFATVSIEPTDILAPDIATAHPEIKTWKVFGTDGKVISGVADFTSRGLHAMLDMANGDTLFIEPQTDTSATTRQYLSFRKSANAEAFRSGKWSCTSQDPVNKPSFANTLAANRSARTAAARAGETLHTYRLAVAATGEYTTYYGSQSAAFSAIVTAVNRINQIYERDLSTRLTLVSDTNVVFTNANTDPYTNSSAPQILKQNTSTLDSILGNNNYDIGHVFTMVNSGMGLALLGVVCDTQFKAQGVSGLPEPKGDAFIIDFVAHEIGHQLGASHTFNGLLGTCSNNREPRTAFEPGSGTSIMAYAGLCSQDNTQTFSDSAMHAASILQIQQYLHEGNGASCANKTSLTNRNPSANAGADYTIPAATPFILSGSGSDPDGDTLSYSWEQSDAGTASNVNVDTGDNALIRTRLPSDSPQRIIPTLSDLANQVQTAGEVLPVTNRELNFLLQVRDGRGGTAYDEMQINVRNTGQAFAVTSPRTTSLLGGSQQTVNWNIANTHLPPINCATVDIAANNTTGSFITLISNTPNDGTEVVTLPSNLGSRTHILVKCHNNIFFALSATNPAKASASSDSNTNITTPDSNTGSGGGGGSIPTSWLWLAGLYALLRLRKGEK
ncbi:MAG: M12 family metallo-peptidase [Candidatus Thiothrix putei]|uniref:M12 family metallo-peptidase n=1 Tax=Candidatus Thiothrix putei TaxID=3080811 RepID=A0AA95KHY7_9GAMM|nr:MAG: M12 family metallo-peptidase [Candidatus Thiothrix putei]